MKIFSSIRRSLKKRRWVWGALAAVVVAGIGLGIFFSHAGGSKAQTNGLGPTVVVTRGDIAQTVVAYGTVAPKQQYTFTFDGSKLRELLVSVGDRVAEGQVLVRLDDTQEQLALLQAERALAEAKVQGIPATIKEKELSYTLAKANLEKTTIRAPFSGIVTELTQATSATENWSLTLIDTSELFVEVTVDQLDAPSLKVGQRGQVVIEPLPQQVWPVEIVKIGGRAIQRGSSTVVSVTGKFLTTDPAVIPGYTIQLEVTVASATNVLRVPISALVRSARGYTVMKVSDGQAVPQAVTIGITSSLYAEVKSGLNEGDVILLNPSSAAATTSQPSRLEIPMPPGGGPFIPGGP